MIRWPRFTRRRRRKLYPFLSLLSLLNLIFPQHAAASTTAVSIEVQPEQFSTAALGRVSDIALPTPPPAPAKRSTRVVVTAYSSSFGETDGDPFTTASGAKVADGVIAANGLRFGTKVRFPDVYGDKVFTVLDRMSARYGRSRVDIWMPTKQAAMQWGVRSVRMEILK